MLIKAMLVLWSVVGRDIKQRSCYDALFRRVSIESRQEQAQDASTVKADSTAGAPDTQRDV